MRYKILFQHVSTTNETSVGTVETTKLLYIIFNQLDNNLRFGETWGGGCSPSWTRIYYPQLVKMINSYGRKY